MTVWQHEYRAQHDALQDENFAGTEEEFEEELDRRMKKAFNLKDGCSYMWVDGT